MNVEVLSKIADGSNYQSSLQITVTDIKGNNLCLLGTVYEDKYLN